MGFFRKLKKRIIEPSTMTALSLLALIIKPDFDVETLEMIYNGALGVLAGLGIITPEASSKKEE